MSQEKPPPGCLQLRGFTLAGSIKELPSPEMTAIITPGTPTSLSGAHTPNTPSVSLSSSHNFHSPPHS